MTSALAADSNRPALQAPPWLLLAGYLSASIPAWLLCAVIYFSGQIGPLQFSPPWNWLDGLEIDPSDTELFFWLLPLSWISLLIPIGRRSGPRATGQGATGTSFWLSPILAATVTAGLSLALSVSSGAALVSLPPAYHDEFSYLFQAECFLRGEFGIPVDPGLGELLQPMHVVHDRLLASRYFPGTALWLTPFLAVGQIYWGPWLASAGTVFFMSLTAGRLSGVLAAWLTGLLIALSPGNVLFSTTLLSHPPTLLGLSLFYCSTLQLLERPGPMRGSIAGLGLALAMLCRPLTAAACAFPWGLLLIARGIQQWRQQGRNALFIWLLSAAGLIGPLLIGGGLMLWQNQAVTGSITKSPYTRFNEQFTPRHRYGFGNAAPGTPAPEQPTFERYDQWAENLDLSLAVRNEVQRCIASGQWTVGLIPLAIGLVLIGTTWSTWSTGLRLMLVSAGCLHLAYVPYWYAGILHWHYVFETGPIGCLLIADLSARGIRACWTARRPLAVPVLIAIVLAGPSAAYWSPEAAGLSRFERAVRGMQFARLKYARFGETARELSQAGPIVVLVESDPVQFHLDYIHNSPALNAPWIVVRSDPARREQILQAVRRFFPGRKAYLFRDERFSGPWLDR